MEEKKNGTIKDFFTIIIISLAAVFFIKSFVVQPFVVSGASMEPTFHTGDYLIVDRLSYELSHPERGDVAIFKYPVMPSKFFIKRIIGLPGETVRVESQGVFIKKVGSEEFEKLDEYYLEFSESSFVERELNSDEYFVMGDNRPQSSDSRIWGPLNKKFLVGKALIRLFPLNQIDFLPGDI